MSIFQIKVILGRTNCYVKYPARCLQSIYNLTKYEWITGSFFLYFQIILVLGWVTDHQSIKNKTVTGSTEALNHVSLAIYNSPLWLRNMRVTSKRHFQKQVGSEKNFIWIFKSVAVLETCHIWRCWSVPSQVLMTPQWEAEWANVGFVCFGKYVSTLNPQRLLLLMCAVNRQKTGADRGWKSVPLPMYCGVVAPLWTK